MVGVLLGISVLPAFFDATCFLGGSLRKAACFWPGEGLSTRPLEADGRGGGGVIAGGTLLVLAVGNFAFKPFVVVVAFETNLNVKNCLV